LFDGKQGGNDWSELLKEVVTFDSVEEFWGIYVSLPSSPNCGDNNEDEW